MDEEKRKIMKKMLLDCYFGNDVESLWIDASPQKIRVIKNIRSGIYDVETVVLKELPWSWDNLSQLKQEYGDPYTVVSLLCATSDQ